MTPEDKIEFKALIKEVLTEQEETVSPVVKVIQVYKDVDIPEGQDNIVADAAIDGAETVRVSRTLKWSQIYNIVETTKREQKLFEVKLLYKILLDQGPCIYCYIKDIKEFERQWEEAILAYGFI